VTTTKLSKIVNMAVRFSAMSRVFEDGAGDALGGFEDAGAGGAELGAVALPVADVVAGPQRQRSTMRRPSSQRLSNEA
jgi:hypothetical protein